MGFLKGGVGDVLGSISPAFGMASGKGLFGSDVMQPLFGGLATGGMGMGGLLAHLFGRRDSERGGPMDGPKPQMSPGDPMGGQPPQMPPGGPPSIPGLTGQSPSQFSGQSLGQVAASLPQLPQQRANPMDDPQYRMRLMQALGGGDSMTGMGAGLGSLLGRLGVRF